MSLKNKKRKGFTLIELVVSLGLFSIVVLLASGAYLVMVHLNQKAQATTIGINNISFALDSMMRSIRNGHNYTCGGPPRCDPSTSFAFIDATGKTVQYNRPNPGGANNGFIQQNIAGVTAEMTDKTTVNVKSLNFYLSGAAVGDTDPPYVTVIVTGSVSSIAGKTEDFSIETSATMRGTDL